LVKEELFMETILHQKERNSQFKAQLNISDFHSKCYPTVVASRESKPAAVNEKVDISIKKGKSFNE
jgi:hypothetical protein